MRQLAKRIEVDDGTSLLSIRASAKRLVLGSGFGDHHEQGPIISGLTRIESLSWTLWMTKEDIEKARFFQNRCPHLKRVDMFIKGSDQRTPEPESFNKFFAFKNLSHLSYTYTPMCEDPLFPYEHLKFLTRLPSSSPDLASLVLNLNEANFAARNSDSELMDIFVILQHVTLPRLTKFHDQGYPDPDWDDVCAESDSHTPLRIFFSRHSQIEDMALVSTPNYAWAGDNYSIKIDPKDTDELFPRLVHFEGPSFLCKAIIRSPLAIQLESLLISDHTLDGGGVANSFSLFDVADSTTELPRLRRLVIMAYSLWPLLARSLDSLLRAASGLQDLEVRSEVDDPEEFIATIQSLSDLHWLTVYGPAGAKLSKILNGKTKMVFEPDEEWMGFIGKIVTLFAHLTVVRGHQSHGTLYDEWEITRVGGEIKVEYMERGVDGLTPESY